MKTKLFYLIVSIGLFFPGEIMAQFSSLELIIDGSTVSGDNDLTRYSLGQGGLSSQPMIDSHLPQLVQLHPKTIRFFIEEYFNLYPAKGKYQWDKLDKMFAAIVATGAQPIPNICFKPAVLFPKVDQMYCHPENYPEWEELIFQLVKHCKEKNYGVKYWEIGNEVDIGESGGCPYLFKPEDYLIYYTHTVNAILRADQNAKAGGPALAYHLDPIGDSLIAYCGRGKAPLNFFSWHGYTNNPEFFRQSINDIKAKLAKYPLLKNTETMITEWNMDLDNPNLNPYFQSAFILEVTHIFWEEGLSISAYYHICDSFVDPNEFSSFISKKGTELMSHWWNVMPQYLGLYDNQGRVRSAYYVMHWLSLLKGTQLKVTGTNADVKAFAGKYENWINMLFWNFPKDGKGEKYEATITLPSLKEGSFRLVRLNPESVQNNVEVLRTGSINDLKNNPMKILLAPYEINWIEISQ